MAPPHGATKDRVVLRGKSALTKQPEDMCGYMENNLWPMTIMCKKHSLQGLQGEH